MSTKPSSSTNVVGSALGVLKALRLIAEHPMNLSTRDLALRLEVSYPTAFRITRTLLVEDLIEYDNASRTYRPSLEFVGLAYSALEEVEIREMARPYLQELVRHFNESVTLAIPDTQSIVFVDRIDGTNHVRFFCDIGRRLPLQAGAAAKAVLAHLPEPAFEEYLRTSLESLTEATKVRPAQLRAEKSRIRSAGYAVSRDEVDMGVSAVGVPILNGSDEVVASVAIANLSVRWSEKDIEKRALRMLELSDTLRAKCRHASASATKGA